MSIGVQLGARYEGSPIVAGEGHASADELTTYVPSSVPGGRAPHFWVGPGRGRGSSLYDRLGRGFTLLRLGPHPPDAFAIAEAASDLRVPLEVLDVADDDARDLYDCDLALIRPDLYVGWRGNRPMAKPERVLARLAGHPV